MPSSARATKRRMPTLARSMRARPEPSGTRHRCLSTGTIFAPTGALVPLAEIAIVKGGRLVRGGVHMNDIPGFGYVSLRYESDLISVAKLTRADRLEFPPLARRLAAAVLVP